MTRERCDVVVIGGGAMGSAAAWWLSRRGRDVVLLEQFERGHVRGSSHGGSRIFRLAYDRPRYVQMAQAALPLWRELESDAGRSLLLTTGGVDHGPRDAVEPVAAALASQGAAYQWLTSREAAEWWPALRFEGDVLFQPDAGCCLADATVAALQERAAAHGARVQFGVRAECRVVADGVEIHTDASVYRAPVAVVAAGSWASGVVPAPIAVAAALPPLRVTKEQVFHFRPHDPGAEWPSFIVHRDPWVYGLLTPGEGVKVAEHGTGAETDPDHRSFDIDEAGRSRVCDWVRSWVPGVDPEPVSATTCLYTTTPTQDFVITRQGPVVIAAGFSGHGFKFTPLVGRLLADLAG